MYIALLIAGLYVFVNVVLFYRRYRFRKTAEKTKGVIVGYESHGRFSHPVIEYVTSSGEQRKVVGSMPRIGGKGKKITVYYAPHHPAKVSYSLGFTEFVLFFGFFVMVFVFVLGSPFPKKKIVRLDIF
jgi:hypothetical protein